MAPDRVNQRLLLGRIAEPLELFAHSGLEDAADEGFDHSSIAIDEAARASFLADETDADDPRPEAMLAAIEARGGRSVFLGFLRSLDARLSRDAILAAISKTIAWGNR